MKKINSNELLENYIKVKTIKNPEKSINTHINELLGNTNNQIMQTSLQQIIPNQIQQIPQQQVVQIQQQIPIENNLDKISINKPKLVHFETQSEVDSSANSLLIRFRELESNLNKCLIKEDLQKSKNIYLEMKYIFTKFPDTYYETKTDLFSDVLSANFRIHKLEEIMNDLQKQELNRMLIDQERKDVIIKEKEKIKSEKEQLEEQINNMQDDIVKFSFKKNDEYDIEPDTIITGNDLNTIKEKARLERLIHEIHIHLCGDVHSGNRLKRTNSFSFKIWIIFQTQLLMYSSNLIPGGTVRKFRKIGLWVLNTNWALRVFSSSL